MNSIVGLLLLVSSGEPVSCGASCLYLLARDQGIAVSLDDASAVLHDSSGGNSLAELHAVARKLGIKSELRNVKQRLKGLPLQAFVAHFATSDSDPIGHFVFLQPLEPTFTQYQLIAPPLEPEVVFASDLLKREDFSGWVMTPSRNHWPITGTVLFASGCLLYFTARRFR